MPVRINSSADFFRVTEADALGNGKDDTSAANAGRTVVVNPEVGLALTTVSVDGDLTSIDSDADALSSDPTAHDTGAASTRLSHSYLFRWITRLIQVVAKRLPASLGATTAANSFPVAIPTDQLSTLATSANQGTANTALAAIRNAVESTVTIDGAVDLGPIDNAVLDAIQAATEGTAAALSDVASDTGLAAIVSELQLKVNATDAQPVSNAALSSLGGAISGNEVQVDVVGHLPVRPKGTAAAISRTIAVADTWEELTASNANRSEWGVNPAAESYDIGVGDSGSEVYLFTVPSTATAPFVLPSGLYRTNTERLVVRCAATAIAIQGWQYTES